MIAWRTVVTACWECPFLHETYLDESDAKRTLTCVAPTSTDRDFIGVTVPALRDAAGTALPPPFWCPLRKCDRLISLGAPPRHGKAKP